MTTPGAPPGAVAVPSAGTARKVRPRRRRFWTIALAVATGVVVVLLILIGVGYLVIPGINSTPSYTITSVVWTVEQGNTPTGSGWFGPSHFTWGSPAYPSTVTAGKVFTITFVFSNFDTVAHNITSVFTQPPFKFSGSSPGLPVHVGPAEDDARIILSFTAPDQDGGSGVLNITVDALG